MASSIPAAARAATRAAAAVPSAYPSLRARPPVIADNVYDSFASAVGNTPLIRLADASRRTGCEIYGKAEFMNPGGSVKDRAGLYLVADGEEKGVLTPGQPGIIVEATAGNTGIGLTLAANSRGYRTIIVIPDTQSQEKKDTLRFCGAQLFEVPAVPFKNPRNYVHVARRLVTALQSHPDRGSIPVFYANQWDNTANRRAHVETTGPELLAQLRGRIDGFSCAMGTGGTLAGTAEALRAALPGIRIGLTDPQGAVPYTFYTTGEAVAGQGSSVSEGIGQGRITGNMEGFRPDFACEIPDSEALAELNSLAFTEGLQVGLSSGINVAGAVRMAKEMGPGHTIVTVLCDGAMKYTQKMFNPGFLRTKALPVPQWLDSNAKQYLGGSSDADAAAAGAGVSEEAPRRGGAATAQALLPFDLDAIMAQAMAGDVAE